MSELKTKQLLSSFQQIEQIKNSFSTGQEQQLS